jgi:2-haloacid dehalogenase
MTEAGLRRPTTVVFDVGNVLLRWDPRNLYRKLFDDEARMEQFLSGVCTPAWNLEFDRGYSFADGVAELIAKHPEWASHIRAFDERWHEMVSGVIEENVDLLRRLRQRGVPIYAITNFSREKYAEALDRYPFFRDFEGVIVSGHERLIKPDPAIYRLFLTRYNLEAVDCVFIDDSEENVKGAASVGMHAIRYADGMDLAAALEKLGIMPPPRSVSQG